MIFTVLILSLYLSEVTCHDGKSLSLGLGAAGLQTLHSDNPSGSARRSSVKSSLIGFTVFKDSYINVIKYELPDLLQHLWIENVTTVDTKGLTPTFSSAYCVSTGIYAIAINDKKSPRVVWMNLFERKVLGVVIVNGILIDNLECDDKGRGIAYTFQLGYKHNVIQIDFATFSIYRLMSSSYKSYGGSALDSYTKRFFTVAVTPNFESYNYSLSTLEYENNKEILTPPFKGYGIGGLLYDTNLTQPLAFVQMPAKIEPGVTYKCYLAVLDVCRGTVMQIAGPWPGVIDLSKSGLTIDFQSAIVYVMTEKRIRAVNLNTKQVIIDKSTAGLIPSPTYLYEFVSGI